MHASSANAGVRANVMGSLCLAAFFVALQAAAPAAIASDESLMRLLGTRRCERCDLIDSDLVHADLREAILDGARLQHANLSQARLDGARLIGADLRYTSLFGASLRGADLRAAKLEGADLRQADITGAKLDPGALGHSHWEQARGVSANQLSYAEMHNAGVAASNAGRHPEAEKWLNNAIKLQPEAAISWVARGISRNEQGKSEMAASDFTYAANLYRMRGEDFEANMLENAAKQLTSPAKKSKTGNGSGGQLLSGAIATLRMLVPLAQIAGKSFLQMGF